MCWRYRPLRVRLLSGVIMNIRRQIDAKIALYQDAVAQTRRKRHLYLQTKKYHTAALEAQERTQIIAEAIQTKAHSQLAAIVRRCLESIYDEPYGFEIRFERKRGKTEAKIVFTRDGNDLEDPIEEAGGGCVAIAAFALRLACLLLSRPKKRRVLFLDEPFGGVQVDLHGRIRDLLMTLAEEMEVQIVLITHAKTLECGRIIRL